MKLNKILKSLLQKCDLFSTSQFLRYKGDQEYKTATGGFCSLIVVILFMALFMNTAIQTIEMTNITWTSSTSSLFDPSQSFFTIQPTKKPFMFAVGILGVNLNNSTHRFFDFTIIDYQMSRGNIEDKRTVVNMVPCTVQHFAINQEIKQSISTLQTSRWLCPPLGFSFGLHGKYTSKTSQYLSINVNKCNDTLDPLRPCAPDSDIDNLENTLGRFSFSIFYINPLINPGDQNYLSYYLQDRNYITFTRQLGGQSNGFIQDFSIYTDVNLLPFTKNVIDQGTIISDLFQNVAYQVTDGTYASFYLLKSSTSTTYSRQFGKIDTFFSYVGGLVGTILGLMFIVTKYTQFSFELDLAQQLFSYKDGERIYFNVNILRYFKYLFYRLFRILHSCIQLQELKQQSECRQQIQKQLSIDFILQRINFMENAVQAILNDNQIYGLHLQKYESIKKAKQRRQRYKAKSQQSEEESWPSQSEQSKHYNNNFNNIDRNIKMNDPIGKNMQESFGQFKQNQQISRNGDEISKRRKNKQVILDRLRNECEEGNKISQKILSKLSYEITLNSKINTIQKNDSKDIHHVQTEQFKIQTKIMKQDQFMFAN